MNEGKNMKETDDTSFAELFEQSFKKPTRLEPGQKVEAVIVKITDEWVFLDLGGKSEGYLDRKELLDADGNLTAAEGDRISAYFLSSANNEKLFTIKLHGGAAGNQYLEEAFHNHIPVEGVAEKEIKGGYEIKIAGTIRGFCPTRRWACAAPTIRRTLSAKNCCSKSPNTATTASRWFCQTERCLKRSASSSGRN